MAPIQIIIAVLLLIITTTGAYASEIVTFKGDDQETVTGKLIKPEGKGPFPAVILLHGLDGMEKHYDVWAERLAGWGYVTLQMDDFGPRGKSSLSDPPSKRAKDICSAQVYLSGLRCVDPENIGAMGWSRRGSSAFAALCAKGASHPKKEYPLRAVITFYPYCFRSLANLDFPLLILIGELDDFSPVGICRERMPKKEPRHEVVLKAYPGAYHGFDVEGAKTEYMEHRIQYNPAAAADSIIQVKAFLEKYMK